MFTRPFRSPAWVIHGSVPAAGWDGMVRTCLFKLGMAQQVAQLMIVGPLSILLVQSDLKGLLHGDLLELGLYHAKVNIRTFCRETTWQCSLRRSTTSDAQLESNQLDQVSVV